MIVCTVAVFSVSAPVLAQAIARDEERGSITDRGIILPASEWSYNEIYKLAQQFLKTVPAGAPLARLIIATDHDRLMENYYHGTPYNNTAKTTIEEIRKMGLPKGPLARVLVVNGRAKLSYLDQGQLTEHIFSGATDPTVLHDGNIEYEVLHFRLDIPHPNAFLTPYIGVVVYLRASPQVSISSSIRITRMLEQMTNAEGLSVEIRPDTWFLTDQKYPAVLAFSQSRQVPDELHFSLGARVGCGPFKGSIKCSGEHFFP